MRTRSPLRPKCDRSDPSHLSLPYYQQRSWRGRRRARESVWSLTPSILHARLMHSLSLPVLRSAQLWTLKILSERPDLQRKLHYELGQLLPHPSERAPTTAEVHPTATPCQSTTPKLRCFPARSPRADYFVHCATCALLNRSRGRRARDPAIPARYSLHDQTRSVHSLGCPCTCLLFVHKADPIIRLAAALKPCETPPSSRPPPKVTRRTW